MEKELDSHLVINQGSIDIREVKLQLSRTKLSQENEKVKNIHKFYFQIHIFR